MATASSAQTTGGTGQHRRKGPARAFYWMVLPALALFLMFHTIPVLQGMLYSFTDSPGYGDWNFVGLSNYAALFTDDRVRSA